jgi:predicted nucleic acid-binding protein
MSYLDACYLAKFYLAEPDSARVTAFVLSQPAVSCLSVGKTEVVSVFHRKFREKVVDEAGFHLLCDQFETDCAAGLWRWLPLDDALLKASTKRLRAVPSTTFLRAVDALHLTCAVQEGFTAIQTSDRHMLAAAPAFGLRAVVL